MSDYDGNGDMTELANKVSVINNKVIAVYLESGMNDDEIFLSIRDLNKAAIDAWAKMRAVKSINTKVNYDKIK